MKTLWITLLAAMAASSALAHDFRTGDIVIDHPYALAGGSSVYLRTLRNKGTQPERLVAASSPTFGRVALLHDGRQDPLMLPAGAEVQLRHTGTWRLELLDLKTPLKLGDSVSVTLRFEHAGDITVPADVVDTAARHPH
jgi:copper(I)-binding protein